MSVTFQASIGSGASPYAAYEAFAAAAMLLGVARCVVTLSLAAFVTQS
jgi:hypothetical protein